jgi:hypothetical protein
MRSRGTLIVLAILLLAIALAVVNMVVQTRSSQRAVEHWGAQAARLILTASRVEVLQLGDKEGDGTADFIEASPQRLPIAGRRDASQSPGILHVRRALVSDSLYDWDALPSQSPVWRYALRFREGDATFTLLLDDACSVIQAAENDASRLPIRANPKGGSPLEAFIQEQFPPQPTTDAARIK